MAHKEQDAMAEQLRAQHYQVFRDKKRHYRVFSATGQYLATFAGTSADRRWRDKLKTDMQRREREYAQQAAVLVE